MRQARRDQGAGSIAFKSGCARMAGEDGDSMSLKEKLRQGRTVSHEEIKREFDL